MRALQNLHPLVRITAYGVLQLDRVLHLARRVAIEEYSLMPNQRHEASITRLKAKMLDASSIHLGSPGLGDGRYEWTELRCMRFSIK